MCILTAERRCRPTDWAWIDGAGRVGELARILISTFPEIKKENAWGKMFDFGAVGATGRGLDFVSGAEIIVDDIVVEYDIVVRPRRCRRIWFQVLWLRFPFGHKGRWAVGYRRLWWAMVKRWGWWVYMDR